MWPWGHAAVGYLLYSLGCRLRGRRVAVGPLLALAVGTQFPDLVDKPLGWTLGVLPGGRTLAHSLLTLAIVAAVVLTLARRVDRPETGGAFVLGSLSQTLADGLYAVVEGEYVELSYLLWPVLPLPPVETEPSFAAHITGLLADPFLAFELVLVAITALVWWIDGRPGLSFARTFVGDSLSRLRRLGPG